MSNKYLKAYSDKLLAFVKKDMREAPWIARKLHNTFRVFYAVTRDVMDRQFSLRAMSLVYTTLITIVPLLAISFSVLKGLGVTNQIEPALRHALSGLGQQQSAEITEKIIGFVDNVEVGVLGVIGLGLLIYSVIALMQKIEWSFNAIWRVGKGRSMARRVSDYLTVLFVGPLAIFLSTGATALVRKSTFIASLENSFFLAPILNTGAVFVPWVVLAIGFAFAYMLMPNTQVRFYPALIGGLFAALIWKFMGFLFSSFVANASSYVAIYAAFATLILFMIWIYIGWLVVLIGANISFYVQNPNFIARYRSSLAIPPRLIEAYGLNAIYYIGAAHNSLSKEAPTTDWLAEKINAPGEIMEKILNTLKEAGLIINTEEDNLRWHPGVSFSSSDIMLVYDALESYGYFQGLDIPSAQNSAPVKNLLARVEKSRRQALGGKSISDTLGLTEKKT